MRKAFAVAAVVMASLAAVLPGEAQTSGQPGQFYGGMTPQNLQFKPINVGTASMPTNLTQATMPQAQSSKVFNIGHAFRNLNFPVFRSTNPSMPIVRPGKNNPLQPVNKPLGPLPSMPK